MRATGVPFDAVGRESVIQTIYESVDPIDDYWRGNFVSQEESIEITVVDPKVIRVD